MITRFRYLAAGFWLTALAAPAAPLEQATISKIINEVKIIDPASGARAAKLDETIQNDVGVKTGPKSRAELLFQDQTLTRLGAETYFSFQPGTRDLTLKEGTMLLQVPKNIGGATIHTAAVTAAITGTTIMMEYLPGHDLKVLVLEGSLRLTLNSRVGEAVTLKPGKMVLMKPGDKRLPDPVDVDLGKLIKTSSLVDPAAFKGKSKVKVAPLPSLGLIQQEIAGQQAMKNRQGLVETNLLIAGKGNQVVVASSTTMDALSAGALPNFAPAAPLTTATVAQQTVSELAPVVTTSSDSTSSTDSKTGALSDKVDSQSGKGHKHHGKHGRGDSGGTDSGGGDSGDGDGSVTPTPPPTPPTPPPGLANTPLPTIYTPSLTSLTAAAAIDPAGRTLTIGGTTLTGGTFQSGEAVPYLFLTGANDLDRAIGFNANFGARAGKPANGVTVFRFSTLQLGSAPTFVGTGGDLALISFFGITPAAGNGAWALDSLHSFTLASASGDVQLTHRFTAAIGSDFASLEAYARTGQVAVTAPLDLPGASVMLTAGGYAGLVVTGGAPITAARTTLNSIGNLSLSGAVQTGVLNLNVGATAFIDAAPTAGTLNISANSLDTSVNLTTGSGALSIGTGGLYASTRMLTGFTTIDVSGDAIAGTLQAAQRISIDGNVHGATAGASITLDAPVLSLKNGIDVSGADGLAPGAGGTITLLTDSLTIGKGKGDEEDDDEGDDDGEGHGKAKGAATQNVGDLVANGGKGISFLPQAGGDGGTVKLGTAARPITGNVTINGNISAVNGQNSNGFSSIGGTGGTVNVTANGTVAVAGKINVSNQAALGGAGGQIRLESRKASGTAITVTNSAQLLSLLAAAGTGAGGHIQFVSAGGDINLQGGTVQADRGQIEAVNNGAAGTVTLGQVTLRGDVVKIGALGSNGQLILGGGTIDANSAIKLFAGGANGTVHFIKDTTLSGSSLKTIAADTVTIDNKQKVTVNGPAVSVFTNHGNYSGSGGNGSTTGTFKGSGAVTLPYAQHPSY